MVSKPLVFAAGAASIAGACVWGLYVFIGLGLSCSPHETEPFAPVPGHCSGQSGVLVQFVLAVLPPVLAAWGMSRAVHEQRWTPVGVGLALAAVGPVAAFAIVQSLWA